MSTTGHESTNGAQATSGKHTEEASLVEDTGKLGAEKTGREAVSTSSYKDANECKASMTV